MNIEANRIKKLLLNDVTKRNFINELRQNDFTAPELKIFSVYLSRIDTRENTEAPKTRKVRFSLEDFQKLTGLKRLRYSDMKPSIDRLLDKKLHFPNENQGISAFHIFSKIDTGIDEKGNKYIDINAHDEALPYLFDIKGSYMHYKLWNVLRLKSSNQVRMYEILKQWIDKEPHSSHEFEVNELRELLGIPADKYPRFQNFKERILDNCAEALKTKTDIYFTYRSGKTGIGGKWKTIIFDIFKNTDGETAAFDSIFSELTACGDPAGSPEQEAAAASQLPSSDTAPAQTYSSGDELKAKLIEYAHSSAPSEQAEPAETIQDIEQIIRLDKTAFDMACVAPELGENDILEIKYAMEEKHYSDIFLSFKRIYQTAKNNCSDITKLKKYILKIIEKDTKGLETA